MTHLRKTDFLRGNLGPQEPTATSGSGIRPLAAKIWANEALGEMIGPFRHLGVKGNDGIRHHKRDEITGDVEEIGIEVYRKRVAHAAPVLSCDRAEHAASEPYERRVPSSTVHPRC